MTQRNGGPGWGELMSRVVQALGELVSAELDGLKGDLADTGRRVARLAALAGAAFGVAFWGLGALLAGAIAALALWLPTWAAALVVAGALLLIGGALALRIRSAWRRLESPVDSVRRRVDDHVAWWHDEVLGDSPRIYRSRQPEAGAGGEEEL